jgi:hypothetical protein
MRGGVGLPTRVKQDALHGLGNKGLGNMGKGTKAGVAVVWAAALLAGAAAPALAQTKELSDKSVMTLMKYAWGMVPQKFTTPLGKTIEVDKTKPSDSIVPLETAREIIHAARLSAYAQLCELVEEQRANYQTLMRREEAKAKWTDQQMLFINQLHLFTVMTLTGKVALVEKDGDKQVVVQEGKPAKTGTCSDTERKKVQEQIMAFVSTTPAPAPPVAAAGPPSSQPAQPTPASQKSPAGQKK